MAQGCPPSTRSQLRDDRRTQPGKRAESPGALWNTARLGAEDEERRAQRQEGLAQRSRASPRRRRALPSHARTPGQDSGLSIWAAPARKSPCVLMELSSQLEGTLAETICESPLRKRLHGRRAVGQAAVYEMIPGPHG